MIIGCVNSRWNPAIVTWPLVSQVCVERHVYITQISGAWSSSWWKGEGKFGAHAMKRVAAGAHLSTSWLFEPAKRPDDRTRDREVSSSKLACVIFFSLIFQARKLIGTARWPNSLGMLSGPSPHYCSPIKRAPLHSSVKTSTWCLQ